jgi:nitrile hydratase accessory protein
LSTHDTAEVGPLARHDGGPAFEEAWQVEILALAFALCEKGVFSRTEWSEALGSALRQAASQGAPDDQGTYYRAALAALEELLERDGRIGPKATDDRTEQWRRAYAATPHGQPVELSAGVNDTDLHSHSH